MNSQENIQNVDSSSNHSSADDDIVILNIGSYDGYKSESLIIMRIGNETESEAVDTIKNAAMQYTGNTVNYEEKRQSSMEVENRVECIKMEGYENIPDGVYILYRLQEKINENNRNLNPVNVINEDSVHENTNSNQTSLNASERGSKKTSVFHRMIHLLENLNSPSGFVFEDIKSHLRTNGLELNSKQLNGLLYRAVKKEILERIPGAVRRYRFKI